MVTGLGSKWLQKNWEKWLRKNLKHNGYRRKWNKMVTEKLITQWLQVLDQNGYRRTGKNGYGKT
jgi:hypothetical protein